MTQGDSHDEQGAYLKYALRRALPGWFVGRDLAVYWVPGRYRQPYAGPDVLVARGRPREPDPKVFVVYEDGPLTLVGEVASDATRDQERKKRDEKYAAQLHVPEYLFIDLPNDILELWTLVEGRYRPLSADSEGILWSGELAGIGFAWDPDDRFIRVVTRDGRMIPTPQEEAAGRAAAEQRAEAEYQRAEAEYQRAEAERERADSLAAELERLRRALGDQS